MSSVRIATREVGDPGVGPDLSGLLESIRGGKNGAYAYVALLGLKDVDPVKVLRLVQKGLSYRTVERFQRNLSLSLAQLTEIVQIPPTTLTRRREKGRLTPEESDRLMRAARLFAKALELFEGDGPAAKEWLSNPQIALGGERPLTISRTDVGAREVEAVIDRLEHGVFI